MTRPVVLHCLHGFLGAPSDWPQVLPSDGSALSYSLHRIGGEGLDGVAARVNELSEHRDQTAEGLGFGEMHVLLGYSMGGRIALHALLQRPDLWDAAVILSAHPGLPASAVEERAARLKSDGEWARRFQEEPWDQVVGSWNRLPVFQGGTHEPLRKAEDYSRSQLAHALNSWSLGTQEDLRPRLRAVSAPILWVAGERDPKYVALAQECARLNPEFESVILENAGHRAPWDAPLAFQSVLKKFLGQFSPKESKSSQKETCDGKRVLDSAQTL